MGLDRVDDDMGPLTIFPNPRSQKHCHDKGVKPKSSLCNNEEQCRLPIMFESYLGGTGIRAGAGIQVDWIPLLRKNASDTFRTNEARNLNKAPDLSPGKPT